MHTGTPELAADDPVREVGYRKAARFIMDIGKVSTQLDRNQKARILHSLEALERASKRRGCPNGIVTRPALAVARVLLLRFHNGGSGHCYPSYDAIKAATGFCRATIAKALGILERIGVLKITRRLVRARDGAGRLRAKQGSNIYAFQELPRLTFLAAPAAKPRPTFGQRVHAMVSNHKPQAQISRPKPFWMREELAQRCGKAWNSASDWRERARAIMKR